MLAKANYFADKLDLPLQKPICETNVQFRFIVPPTARPYVDIGGRIDVNHYSFSCGDKHCFITKLDPFGNLSSAEQNEMLSHEKSLIATNQAYQLATNWLTSIDVNIKKLEKRNRYEVRQRWCFGDNGDITLLPIFYVRWGNWNEPTVEVSVDGRNKELLELRMINQASFTSRPAELIRDLDKLLSIPDLEFQKYSLIERSNLVARFSTISYSNQTNILKDLPP